MSPFQKPPELYDGLRLHQNENTGGCSPRVLEALRALRADQIGFYPPYAETIEACARYLGAPPDSVALVNGLDEGITGIAIAYLRSSAGGFVPEAIVPEPAFGPDPSCWPVPIASATKSSSPATSSGAWPTTP